MSAIQKLSDQQHSCNDLQSVPDWDYVHHLTMKYFKVLDENIHLQVKISRMEFDMEMHNISSEFV